MTQRSGKIQTLLLDADGVVQITPGAFINSLQALCPDASKSHAFIQDIFAAEKPSLSGAISFPSALEHVLHKWGIAAPLADVLNLWHQIEPVPEVLSIVSALRGQGICVCLATNQQAHRANVMANHLDYASQFDELFFSCALGTAKPSSQFFRLILDKLGAVPGGILFIDDHVKNVAAAEAIGMAGAQFHVDDGIALFQSILERYELCP